MADTRTETDSFGPLEVPSDKYWGAQTQRSIINFPIGWEKQPVPIIRALGVVKKACAMENLNQGNLDQKLADAITAAATEVIEGKFDDNFPLVVWQTGSGTQSNMNANEVISNRGIELAKGEVGSKDPVHPNDHVNCGQSSNDVIPTTIHVAGATAIHEHLIPALRSFHQVLSEKEAAFDDIVKSGRTHLMDATPIRLGQEFSGYAAQVEKGIARAEAARDALLELALGGTAVGTGINRPPDFPGRAIAHIREETGLAFTEAANHFEAQAARDDVVEAHGQLKTIAASLTKIANDIRWLGSGPRTGFGEIRLPEIQPGSSIMPGKVNPVMSEALTMVCAQVMGNDVAINIGGASGSFELNVYLPMMADNLLSSTMLLAGAVNAFNKNCAAGIEPNAEQCRSSVKCAGNRRAR